MVLAHDGGTDVVVMHIYIYIHIYIYTVAHGGGSGGKTEDQYINPVSADVAVEPEVLRTTPFDMILFEGLKYSCLSYFLPAGLPVLLPSRPSECPPACAYRPADSSALPPIRLPVRSSTHTAH